MIFYNSIKFVLALEYQNTADTLQDVLRAYIREIDQQGLLEPVPTDPQLPPPPVGPNTERWLENAMVLPLQTGSSTAEASSSGPPSFDSLNTPTDSGGAKEMVIREDNMKYPLSMKLQRPKPESRRENSQKQLVIPLDGQLGGSSRSVSPTVSPIPLPAISSEKDPYYLNTDGSSNEGSDTDDSSKQSMSPSYGQIITTKNLIAMSQALTIRSQSPTTFRSQSSFIDEGDPRSMATRSMKQLDLGTTPSQSGAVPNSSAIEEASSERPSTGARSRPVPTLLAPDSHGDEIPPDAKWTKINRRLVSPEVLDQDHRRYEAYVA